MIHLNATALAEPRSLKIRRVVVTPELLLDLLKVGTEGVITDGFRVKADADAIPKSATALRCGITEFGDIQLLIQDESFSRISEGCAVPVMTPNYSVEKVG